MNLFTLAFVDEGKYQDDTHNYLHYQTHFCIGIWIVSVWYDKNLTIS